MSKTENQPPENNPDGNLDIRGLAAISAAAELGSIKLASEQLNTTQSTLSRLIHRAEDELQVRLFRRGWSGTETTREGDTVCQCAKVVQDIIDAAEEKIFQNRPQHPKLESGLTLTHLQTISAVYQYRSATQAAKELGTSQPSVSRILSHVQQYFGIELFERNQRGLDPLPAAQHLSDLYGKVDNLLLTLRERLSIDQDHIAGRVAIGVLPFSGQHMIPLAFTRISEKHPHVRLVFVPGTYPSLVRALQRGEIEGFVGIMRKEHSPAELIETPLLKEEYAIVARSDHPVHSYAKSIVDLSREKWIVPPFGSPVRAYIERVFSANGIFPNFQTCEIQFFTAVEQMISDSDAVGIQTYSKSGLKRLRNDLRKVEVPLPLEPAIIGLTTLHGRHEEAAFTEFKRIISELAPQYS